MVRTTLEFDDDEIVIALASISNDLELDDIEEVLKYLIEGYEFFKDELKKKVKLKRKRGFWKDI